MSKHFINLMAAVVLLTVVANANATTRYRWCFKWHGHYTDAGFGEDRLNNPVCNLVPARYTDVAVQRTYPYSSTVNAYNLDTDGCTPYQTVFPNQIYKTWQFTSGSRSNRDVYIMRHGENWLSTNVHSYTDTVVLPSSLPSGDHDFPIDAPTYEEDSGMMPVVGYVLYSANTLDFADGTDVWMSTDPDLDCGSWTSVDEAAARAAICIDLDVWVYDKFNIAHEFGHVISAMKDGPRHGFYEGDQGCFRATGVGHQCDCDLTSPGMVNHCPTSREFTGIGQKEGFCNFISAATLNYRSTATSAFVFYKPLMQASIAHHNALGSLVPDPGEPGDIADDPYGVDLSEASNVKWMEWECDPIGEEFKHYGNDWDWLLFFWNLYTEGGDTNRFEVSEIMDVWDHVTAVPVASFCCHKDATGAPDSCSIREWSATCGNLPNPPGFQYEFQVGKLWQADLDFEVTEGVRNQAYSTYFSTNSDKYYHFRNTGIAAGVNY